MASTVDTGNPVALAPIVTLTCHVTFSNLFIQGTVSGMTDVQQKCHWEKESKQPKYLPEHLQKGLGVRTSGLIGWEEKRKRSDPGQRSQKEKHDGSGEDMQHPQN